MERLIFFAVIWIVILAISKGKKEKQARAKKEAGEQQRVHKSAYEKPRDDPRFPPYTPQYEQRLPRANQRQEKETHAARAEKRRPEAQKAQQRKNRGAMRGVELNAPIEARVRMDNLETKASHLVATKGRKDTLEGRGTHAHVEGGIVGGQPDCALQASLHARAQSAMPKSGGESALKGLPQYKNPLVQGVLMAEVLGKPRAMRQASRR